MDKFPTPAAAAVLAAVLLPAAAPPAAAETTLDVHSTFPRDMIFLGEGLLHLNETLQQVSGGEMSFEVHGAGEVVPAFEVFDAVSSGAVPAGWDWVGYWASKVPVAGLVGAMPFGPGPEVFLAWMYDGGGREIMQRAYDPFNVQFFPCHLTAPEPGGWFQKEINTPEDFQGLKMRISGLGGQVLNKLGASTQLIPGGEIYLALERGRIDATEFSLPVIDDQLGFADIAKYYYFPGWHQPASWNSLIINKDVWNGLGDQEKEWIETACRANVVWTMAVAPANQAEQIAAFEGRGIDVRRFPPEVLDALRQASREVLEEEAQKDELFKEAYDSLTSYMERVNRWHDIQRLPRGEEDGGEQGQEQQGQRQQGQRQQ